MLFRSAVVETEEELKNFETPGYISSTGNEAKAKERLENASENLLEKRNNAKEARRIFDEKQDIYQGIDMNWRSLHQGVQDKTAEYERSIKTLKAAEEKFEKEQDKLLKIQAVSDADKTKLEAARKDKEKAAKISSEALIEKERAEQIGRASCRERVSSPV